MFVQEAEILVLAVRPGDKASTTGGGRCAFLKGELRREGGNRQKLLGGDVLPRGRRKYTASQLSSVTLENCKGKRWAVWRDPKLGEGKCTHLGCSGRDQHSDRNLHFQRKNGLLFYHL